MDPESSPRSSNPKKKSHLYFLHFINFIFLAIILSATSLFSGIATNSNPQIDTVTVAPTTTLLIITPIAFVGMMAWLFYRGRNRTVR